MIPRFEARRSADCRLALLLSLVLAGLWPYSCAAATLPEATQKCWQQLRLLAEALGNYRQTHNGSFPASLGELYPKYVSDPGVLRCPAALKVGTAGTADPGLIDPGINDGSVVGYTWELTLEDPEFWEGQSYEMSFARFKKLQRRSLVGKNVPVIRCSHHANDTYLNLTLDGRIYESGLYWECTFVDQLPAVRLDPRLVGQADQPMSKLVCLRSAKATDSMLDLRPWYNARFEDPWVTGDPKMETIHLDRELGRGVIMSQGIIFDAAGIIQLNGRFNPSGGWKGFDVLMYPRAVKSITIKRSFRVMHVLGAVQFEDDPGTIVGTVEIHRAGVPPDKWSWRYGVDVLNYRFVPGEAEAQLESTVVAWAGEFALPEAQKQKPRLFHLRFVTSKPEVVVDHLDFLTGDGFSSPFIVAITLE